MESNKAKTNPFRRIYYELIKRKPPPVPVSLDGQKTYLKFRLKKKAAKTLQ